MARLRVLDLFSGIGGFSLGLEATGGFEVVAHCEIEPFCQEILHRYWPQVKLYKDIKELNYGQLETDGLISKQGDIDLICGGYPCQPFSVAGRKGGEEDPRHLWPEYFRLIRELRPRYAVGENVGGHIRLGLDSVLEDLDSENYTARCFSVEAACVGAPHRRERIFWIAECKENDSNRNRERSHREKIIEYGEVESANGQEREPEQVCEILADNRDAGDGDTRDVADPESNRNQRIPGEFPPAQRGSQSQEKGSEFIGGSSHVPNSNREGLEGRTRHTGEEGRQVLPRVEDDGNKVRSAPRRSGGKGTRGTTDVGNTECNGSSAPEIRGGNEETTGRTPQGTIQTFKSTGTGGFGDNETMADPESEFSERSEPEGNSGGQPQAQAGNRSGAVPDTDVEGLEIGEGVGEHSQAELKTSERNDNQKAESNESPVESWVGDGTYGISAWLDGSWEHGLERVGVNIPQRKAQLMALGNAVVPQLVALVGHAILENHDTIVSETEVKNDRV